MFWQWLQGFHPNTWQQPGCCYRTCRGLCVFPWIFFLRPSLTHHQTAYNVLHHIFRPVCCMCFDLTCSHQHRAQHVSGALDDFLSLWQLPKKLFGATQWTPEHQAVMSPSWSLFLTVWSETVTTLATWRSFWRALVVAILFFLAERSRYWSYSGFKELLWPCPALLKVTPCLLESPPCSWDWAWKHSELCEGTWFWRCWTTLLLLNWPDQNLRRLTDRI